MRVFPTFLAVIAILGTGAVAEPAQTDTLFGFSAIDRQIAARAAMSAAEREAHDAHARHAAETGARELADARQTGRPVDLGRLTAVQVHALCIAGGDATVCDESLRRADARLASANPALVTLPPIPG